MNGQTGLLNPQQARNQANTYNNQQNRLQDYSYQVELGPQNPNANPKSASVSKSIINLSYIAFAITGIIGSFWERFDMVKYSEFLNTFALIWAPLVLAVGGGRAFKNYVNKKYSSEDGAAPSNSPGIIGQPPV